MANPTGLDAYSSGQIYRKDYPMVLAQNRNLAVIGPVRLPYVAGGRTAGQVLAQYTSGPNVNLFDQYAGSGGASGLGTAAAVLFESIDDDGATGTVLARGIFGGLVFYNALFYSGATGLDSNGISNLGARKITDARGVTVLKF
jgi:hypothetical protein